MPLANDYQDTEFERHFFIINPDGAELSRDLEQVRRMALDASENGRKIRIELWVERKFRNLQQPLEHQTIPLSAGQTC